MTANPLVRLRKRLALLEAILGAATFLLIAIAGTALYFAALLMWNHRLDESLLAAAIAAVPGAAAAVAATVLDRRQKAFLEAARGLVAGTEWISPDGLPFTAIDVRAEDLAIGYQERGRIVFIPRELLRPRAWDGRVAAIAYSVDGDMAARKSALRDLGGRYWKNGFRAGFGTVFVAIPALAGVSWLAGEPLLLRAAIGAAFLAGCAYAISSFSKASFLGETGNA